MKPRYITTKEASQLLRISQSLIYKMTMKKTIPHYKVGGKILFKEQELIDFVENQVTQIQSDLPDRFDLLSPFQEAA